MPVHFCWLCDEPVREDTSIEDTHYETGRKVYFCSADHRDEFLELKKL